MVMVIHAFDIFLMDIDISRNIKSVNLEISSATLAVNPSIGCGPDPPLMFL